MRRRRHIESPDHDIKGVYLLPLCFIQRPIANNCHFGNSGLPECGAERAALQIVLAERLLNRGIEPGQLPRRLLHMRTLTTTPASAHTPVTLSWLLQSVQCAIAALLDPCKPLISLCVTQTSPTVWLMSWTSYMGQRH